VAKICDGGPLALKREWENVTITIRIAQQGLFSQAFLIMFLQKILETIRYEVHKNFFIRISGKIFKIILLKYIFL
jgi:hypothetical protein